MTEAPRERTRQMRRLLPAGLAVLLLCGALSAANGQADPTQSATTLKLRSQLVLVDVVVTDHQGQPVTGLKLDDFRLLENGKPQLIRSVDESTAKAARERQALELFVLDELNTPFEDANAARQALKRYLAALPSVLSSPTMLLLLNDNGVKPLAELTTDRAKLIDALAHSPARLPLAARQGDVEKQLTLSLSTLEQLAAACRGLPGRKAVIWLGRGMPGINFANVDPTSAAQAQRAFAGVTNALLEQRMVVYRIDPAPAGQSQASPLDVGLDDAFDTFAGALCE